MSMTSDNPFSKALKWPIKKVTSAHSTMFDEEHFLRTIKWSIYLSAFAIVFSLLTLFVIAVKPSAKIPDTAADFNRFQRVEFVAQNFTEIWLTGTPADAPTIKTMLADQSAMPDDWNTEPMTISRINTADFGAPIVDASSNTTEWSLVIGATLIVPGSDTPLRNYYRVTLIDTPGANVRALHGPQIVNHTRPNTAVKNAYKNSVAKGSTLANTIANFSTAFYTPESGALGRYVSSGFDFLPIKNSPYTGVEVTKIQSATPYPTSPQEGQTLDVIVTVKATITLTTFTTFTVPLTVRAIDNKQWQITDMPTATLYEATA